MRLGMLSDKPVWQIVTRKSGRSDTPEEPFVRLKDEVLHPSLAKHSANFPDARVGMGGAPMGAPSGRYTNDYIEKHVRTLVPGVAGGALGSRLIQQMKGIAGSPAGNVTYEQIFAERVCQPIANIVLVGPTGSGKTHKLEFVWERYIRDLPHCQVRCKLGERLRFFVEVDAGKPKTAAQFLDQVFTAVNGELERRLGALPGKNETPYLRMRYHEFVKWLYDVARSLQEVTSYFHTVEKLGLSELTPKPFAECYAQADDDLKKSQVVLFLLHFCGWLRHRYCSSAATCVFVVVDNVDGATRPVLQALVDLLEQTHPKTSALIVCACRPETLAIEVQVLVDKWVARGMVQSALEKIRKDVFDINAPVTP